MFTLSSFYIFGASALIIFGDVRLERFASFFFAKTSLNVLRFLYLWVAYFSGDTRKEELAKLVYLQHEQASKSLIINLLTQHSLQNHLACGRWKTVHA
ncbi:hypothetical protein [Emticicia aquatica]|uniref:hypothetical protein n=1 Tax=Emticicia aquatica TaxID=1681835 RepID=UPI001EEC6D7D|nr:hypothetical protein [Emticicia aquatica]